MKDKKKFWLIFSVATVVLFVWMIRYKAINQDYRQRWSANTEKTYSVGEIVPIAPDFVGYNLAAEGYMLQVNRFEIVDFVPILPPCSMTEPIEVEFPIRLRWLALLFLSRIVPQKDSL